jgi:lipoprotein-anchoring transpeptidase ErfK/SrfK
MMKKYFLVVALSALAAIRADARDSNGRTDGFAIFGAMPDEAPHQIWRREKNVAGIIDYSPKSTLPRLEKQVVGFTRDMAPGSILVNTAERKLYFVLPGGLAEMYPIGVGKEGFQWRGSDRISRKAVWPDWRPPDAMIRREASKGRFIPAFMPGGPKNPLGARALYIGSTQFRIHGTTQPWSIGRAVSSGCIRMLNEHVIDLYEQVEAGAQVVVE